MNFITKSCLVALCLGVVSPASLHAITTYRPQVLPLEAKEHLSMRGQFSQDGKLFAITSYSLGFERQTFRIWNAQNGKLYGRWRLRRLQTFALSPDGKQLAVITGERQRRGIGQPFSVALRDLRSGSLKRTIIRGGAIDAGIYSLAWSRDGKLLATGSGDGLARVWDILTGRRIATLRAGGSASALQFSSNGKLIATVGENNSYGSQVKLWDWRSKKQLATTSFKTYSHYATLTFSPDDQFLSIGNTSDGITKLYITNSLRQIQTFSAPAQVQINGGVPTPNVTFSPDAKRIALVTGNYITVKTTNTFQTLRRHRLNSSAGPHVLSISFIKNNQLRWVTIQHKYEEQNGIGNSGLVKPKVCKISF